MRSIAKANNTSEAVTFIESNTDFVHWNNDRLPFQQKVKGVVANFAVLNCIENIKLLFEKLALVTANDCYVIATIIDPRFARMTKNYSVLSAIRMQLRSRLTIFNKYKEQFHPTYIHSLKSIKTACGKYFELTALHSPTVSSFAILIFRKK
jgi:hypothetical protein